MDAKFVLLYGVFAMIKPIMSSTESSLPSHCPALLPCHSCVLAGASMAVMISLPLCEAFSCSPAMGETRAFAAAVEGTASALGKFENRAFAARSRNVRVRRKN
jgi:hypothetical protein